MTSITLPKYLMIGVELEFCTPSYISSENEVALRQLGWTLGTDGSLAPREPARMNEIRSKIFRGEFSAQMVVELCQLLKREKAFVTRSCGMHVHFSFTERMKICLDRRSRFTFDLQEKLSKFKPWEERLKYCTPYRSISHCTGFGETKYRAVRYCGPPSTGARYVSQLSSALGLTSSSEESSRQREEMSTAGVLHFEARLFNSTLKPRGIMVAVDGVVNAAKFVHSAADCGRYSDGYDEPVRFY